MTNTVIHVVYFAVAALSLTTYSLALRDLQRSPPREQLAYRGLLRTALSRVGVGLMYSTTGVLLVSWTGAPAWLPLIGFIVASAVWIANARLDVRLKRRLYQSGRGDHERRRQG